ncbi:hypothetical protein [Pseudomonas sp. AE27]|uniref:hypothetical protein n=1 Tax=Pseudomonas sp. AE27 TaxID=3127460 RepID=UPI0030D340B5
MKVIALERGYYGGKIQDPPEAGGQPFDIQSENHLGKWMEPQGWTPSATTKPTASTNTGSQGSGAVQPAFTVKHNGGGRWVVIDATGEKVGDFVGASKDDAQAEADRLTAGGEPYVKPDDTTTGNQGGGAGGDGGNPDDDDEGPDA